MGQEETGNQFGFICPECSQGDELDIVAQIWVRLFPDGSDPDEAHNTDHEWDDGSPAYCEACGWHGHVKDLLVIDEEEDEEQY
jgi:hypothetical protein